MRLINGDLFKQNFNGETFDLIIADIPYAQLWDYKYVFALLNSLLKDDGILAVTVDTGSCFSAFMKYISESGNFFDKLQVSAFEDGENWGNVILMVKKGSPRRQKFQNIINLKKPIGRHPNSKDRTLYDVIVDQCSKEGDSVLDPFMGEGTTALVCKEKKRNYTGIEINDEWFKEALKHG